MKEKKNFIDNTQFLLETKKKLFHWGKEPVMIENGNTNYHLYVSINFYKEFYG